VGRLVLGRCVEDRARGGGPRPARSPLTGEQGSPDPASPSYALVRPSPHKYLDKATGAKAIALDPQCRTRQVEEGNVLPRAVVHAVKSVDDVAALDNEDVDLVLLQVPLSATATRTCLYGLTSSVNVPPGFRTCAAIAEALA
jgi:hypothetical protein